MDTDEIVSDFLKSWQDKKEYQGALLTGSRATGISTSHSDIDLLIVLTNGTDYKERGNKIIDGIVLEYIAYSSDLWTSLFEEEIKKNQRMWLGMWKIGKIIEDKNGEVLKLKEESIKKYGTPIEKLSGEKLEMAKYQLWDGLENLKDLSENSDIGFNSAYYLQLSKIVGSYSQYLGIMLPAVAKWRKFFQDGLYRKLYGLTELPDVDFVERVTALMKNPDLSGVVKLTEYTLDKMGGFKIDGWVLRETSA